MVEVNPLDQIKFYVDAGITVHNGIKQWRDKARARDQIAKDEVVQEHPKLKPLSLKSLFTFFWSFLIGILVWVMHTNFSTILSPRGAYKSFRIGDGVN